MPVENATPETQRIFEQYKLFAGERVAPFSRGWSPASDELKQVAASIKKLPPQECVAMLRLAFDALGDCLRRACER